MTDLFLKNLNETFDKAVEGRISQIKIDENFDRLSLKDMMIYSAPGRDIGYICIPGLDFVSSQIDLFFWGTGCVVWQGDVFCCKKICFHVAWI
jgi:hypothetical protein